MTFTSVNQCVKCGATRNLGQSCAHPDCPHRSAANEPESLADYFERTKGEKQRSLKKLGHGQSAANVRSG